MRITLVALLAVIAGLVVGIYASLVGQLTLYPTSAVGGGASIAVFMIGMAVLAFLQE
ncbi:hypothetical protein OG864_00850 [Streptomyces sp. NBC_00124]|uniref:hypothetical protein n=1 Tax=Streptomyces sp. NBC_00124 TaxID=2975662 RepID=UPI00225605A0|nr:hypothetical protein [Streptomyces sp. NBC_00124]MCX5357329.1 hypothetical protein [Streptomyces sp. NBC_00124]